MEVKKKRKWRCNDDVCELEPSAADLSTEVVEAMAALGDEDEDGDDDPFAINLRSNSFDKEAEKEKDSGWKGMIAVYSIPGCKLCKATKDILHQRNWPYKEIDIEAHPELLSELKELTSKQTVPQVFFNEVHVGGHAELQFLLDDTARLEELLNLVRTAEPPANAPTVPNKAEPPSVLASLAQLVSCEEDKYWELCEEMRKHPKQGGLVKNRKYHLRTYKNCFVGREAVDYFIKKGYAADRQAAVAFGDNLLRKHYFHHVVLDHSFKDDYYFYRFLQDEDLSALTLNSGEASNCEPEDATQLGKDLRKVIIAIYDQFLTPDGTGVDYDGIAASKMWKHYLKKVSQLQRVDLTKMNRVEELAFWINIYNVLVIHGTVHLGPPTSGWSRYKFFSNIGYIISGYHFSLNDIEHGILRANAKPPLSRKKQFSNKDHRVPFALEELDPRIHFALVCGAKSCPAIKTYQPDNVDDALDAAARAFFEGDGITIFNRGKFKEVKVSKILEWYGTDFGATDQEKLEFIMKYAPEGRVELLRTWINSGEKIKITYAKYNWNLNRI